MHLSCRHIERVRKLAICLARQEQLPVINAEFSTVPCAKQRIYEAQSLILECVPAQESSVYIVEVSALLHDVQDWKYSQSESASKVAVQVLL